MADGQLTVVLTVGEHRYSLNLSDLSFDERVEAEDYFKLPYHRIFGVGADGENWWLSQRGVVFMAHLARQRTDPNSTISQVYALARNDKVRVEVFGGDEEEVAKAVAGDEDRPTEPNPEPDGDGSSASSESPPTE